MKPSDNETTVYYTLHLDSPPRRMTAAERKAFIEHPIDLSDLPEQDIDHTWYMPNWPARFAARAAGIDAIPYSAEDTST